MVPTDASNTACTDASAGSRKHASEAYHLRLAQLMQWMQRLLPGISSAACAHSPCESAAVDVVGRIQRSWPQQQHRIAIPNILRRPVLGHHDDVRACTALLQMCPRSRANAHRCWLTALTSSQHLSGDNTTPDAIHFARIQAVAGDPLEGTAGVQSLSTHNTKLSVITSSWEHELACSGGAGSTYN